MSVVDPNGAFPESRVGRDLREAQLASLQRPALTLPDWSFAELAERGARTMVFGDGPGSASYERHLALAKAAGLQAEFPLMGYDERALAKTIAETFVAVLTAVRYPAAPRSWVGRTYSSALLAERPADVHATGGRGEFHTFVCAGPSFHRPLAPRWSDLEHVEGWAVAHLVPGSPRGYG